MSECTYLSKLINLIYLVIIAAVAIAMWMLGHDKGLQDAARPSETVSDILTINTSSVYINVDDKKGFKIVVGKEVKKGDK